MKKAILIISLIVVVFFISGCTNFEENPKCERFPVGGDQEDNNMFHGCRDKFGEHITSDELTVSGFAKQKWYKCKAGVCFEMGNLWKCSEDMKMVVEEGISKCQQIVFPED